jgi:LAO/AO transport system kinase
MIHMSSEPAAGLSTGHHGPDMADAESEEGDTDDSEGWTPPVVETIATTGEGVDDLRDALDDHQQYLATTSEGEGRRRRRAETEIRRLLRSDLGALAEQVLDHHGGMETVASQVARRETDPYTVVGQLVDPLESAVEESLATEPEASEK